MTAFLATQGGLSRVTLLQVHPQRLVIATLEPLVENEHCKVTFAGHEAVEMTALVEVSRVRKGIWLAHILAWKMDEDAPLRMVSRERRVH